MSVWAAHRLRRMMHTDFPCVSVRPESCTENSRYPNSLWHSAGKSHFIISALYSQHFHTKSTFLAKCPAITSAFNSLQHHEPCCWRTADHQQGMCVSSSSGHSKQVIVFTVIFLTVGACCWRPIVTSPNIFVHAIIQASSGKCLICHGH